MDVTKAHAVIFHIGYLNGLNSDGRGLGKIVSERGENGSKTCLSIIIDGKLGLISKALSEERLNLSSIDN